MEVAIAPNGAAVIAQSVLPKDGPSVRFELRVLQLAPDGTSFGAPVTLADSCDCGEAVENLDLALAPGGRIAILWGDGAFTPAAEDLDEPTYHNVLEVFQGTLGGALKRTAQLAAGPRGHSGGGIATDDAGNVLAGWGEGVPGASGAIVGSRYVLALKRAGGAFGAPEDVGWKSGGAGSSASTMMLAVLGPRRAVALIDAFDAGPPFGDGSGHGVLVSRLDP